MFEVATNRFTSRALSELRARLEELRGERVDGTLDAARYVHELELHQIELEMQNRELRESQRRLEVSQARYVELYENAPVAYVTLDARALVIETNVTACTLFGHPRSMLVGAPFAAAARLRDRGLLRAHLRECLASRRQETCELEWVTPAGDVGHLQIATRVEAPVTDTAVRYRVTVFDATAIHRARAEAVQLQAERRARASSDEANRLKDQFIAIVSHELRTPLNSILGWMQIIESRPDDRGVVEHASGVVLRNTRALARIVDDILDVSRIMTGKLRFEMASTDVAGVVRAALDAGRPLASSRGLVVKEAIDDDCVVNGDGERLLQVASNLLSNALKFAKPGGTVKVALARTPRTVRLTVSDDGAGIDPKDLPHVFETFRQADSSTRRAHPGLGLGLAIAKHIVVAHNGEITARSEGVGWGTTVSVDLPASPSPPQPPSRPSARALVGSQPLGGVRVLFVDDEPSSCELTELQLVARGAVVMSAVSADAALELVHAFRPHVLVSDVAMPDRDGYDLIREVRRLAPPLGAIPAIALTAYARAEDADRALEAGFTRHLGKPTELDRLATLIGEVLELAD